MAPKVKKPVDPLCYERGQRVRVIRVALRLSRPAFERKFGISIGTLQNWEDARFGGLGESGSKRLIKAYAQVGIHCTIEWFLYGIGVDPLVEWRRANKQGIKAEKKIAIDEKIQAELGFFHSQHSHVIDTIMPDDAMAPRFFAGDLVAGLRYFPQDLQQAVGRDCIVQTQQGETLVRRVVSGNETQGYTLSCPYHADKTRFPDLKGVALFTAAPVIWVRSV